MRFWDDPEAPLVKVFWYFTDLPFLPFPTIFNSRDWCEDPWHYTGRGEVFGASRNYNGMLHVAGLLGGHYCGTREDFEFGPSWPPTGEPLTYGPDGIPTCCRRDRVGLGATGSRPAALVIRPSRLGYTSSSSRPAAYTFTGPFSFGVVTSGARPAATYATGPFGVGIAASGSRPAALYAGHFMSVGRAASGSRPSAIANYFPVVLGRAASGSRPSAIANYLQVVPGRAASGSRPKATVSAPVLAIGTAASGSRPAAVVENLPIFVGRAASASRPAAKVVVPEVVIGAAYSASRPNASIELAPCAPMILNCNLLENTMVGKFCPLYTDFLDWTWRRYPWVEYGDYILITNTFEGISGGFVLWYGDDCDSLNYIDTYLFPPGEYAIPLTGAFRYLYVQLYALTDLPVGIIGLFRNDT